MIDDIQNYQLKWNHHVLRMPGNRIPCKALQYRPRGKRDLGTPYRRWKDQFMQLQNWNYNPKLRMEEEKDNNNNNNNNNNNDNNNQHLMDQDINLFRSQQQK